MAHPTPETVEQQGIKTPDDFDRETFRAPIVEAHGVSGIELLETVCFREPHASGKMHLNLLVCSRRPCRWLKVAQRLLQHDKVHVGFGENIRTWPEGVVYGWAASEHQGPERPVRQPLPTSTGPQRQNLGNRCIWEHGAHLVQEFPTSTGPQAPKPWKSW